MSVTKLHYEEDRYFAGFGARRMLHAETPQLVVERFCDARGRTTTTVCLRQQWDTAVAWSIRAGGGVRGMRMELVDGPVAVAEGAVEDSQLAEALEVLRRHQAGLSNRSSRWRTIKI